MIKTTTSKTQKAKDEIKQALAKFQTNKFVTVGIHEDTGQHDGGISNAQLGATQHFGATINHPGGTPYGYKTQRDLKARRVRFLKRGEGVSVLGRTQPHQIKIPARPWLDVGVRAGDTEYVNIIKNAVESGESLDDALNHVGVVAVANVQKYIIALRSPPNKASTVRQKGSDNPLNDTGEMRNSVNYKIVSNAPQEGL